VADLERLYRPSLEEHPDGSLRSPQQRDDAAALLTYRYLRLGMVLIVFALGWSLLAQRIHAGCWQGSISAYYYQPVQMVFVGGMVAIGALLIIIKGSTVVEDTLLNLAGALAPIVAFVPTNDEPSCVPHRALGHSLVPGLPAKIVEGARNNVQAYLATGTLALLIGVVILVRDRRQREGTGASDRRGRVAVLATTAAILALGWFLLASDLVLGWHGWSAVLMFVLLALASMWNGWWLRHENRGRPADEVTSARWRALAWLYGAIGAAMLVLGIVIKVVIRGHWDQRTLVLEIVEITLFAAMWVVQSFERWGRVIQAPAA
jgi:hypothetical protein